MPEVWFSWNEIACFRCSLVIVNGQTDCLNRQALTKATTTAGSANGRIREPGQSSGKASATASSADCQWAQCWGWYQL